MVIKFNSTDLAKTLKLHKKSVSKDQGLPILGCVLIKSTGEIGSADMKTFVKTQCKCICDNPIGMSIVVNYKLLNDYISKIGKNKEVELDSKGNEMVNIKHDGGSYQLPIFPSTDWIPEPSVSGCPTLNIQKGELADAIKNTIYTCSDDETRYILNGIFMHTWIDGSRNALRFVGTDGKQMTRIDKTVIGKSEIKATVDKMSMAVVEQLCSGSEGDISILYDDKNKIVAFRCRDFEIITKCMEGNYPNYDQVIRTDHNVRLVLDTIELLNVMKTLPMPKDHNKSPYMWIFNVNGDMMDIIVDVGREGIKAQASIKIGRFTSEDNIAGNMDVCFALNPKMLMGMLNIIKPKNIILNYKNRLNSIDFSYACGTGENWLYILMPMRPDNPYAVIAESKDEKIGEIINGNKKQEVEVNG